VYALCYFFVVFPVFFSFFFFRVDGWYVGGDGPGTRNKTVGSVGTSDLSCFLYRAFFVYRFFLSYFLCKDGTIGTVVRLAFC